MITVTGRLGVRLLEFCRPKRACWSGPSHRTSPQELDAGLADYVQSLRRLLP